MKDALFRYEDFAALPHIDIFFL